MRRESKLTAIVLVAILAAALGYARPGAAQDAKSDKEKIQEKVATLNNPETTKDAETERLLAAGYLIEAAAGNPDALDALKAALDYPTNPAPRVVVTVLNALAARKEVIPSALVDLVINRLGDDDPNIATQAEKALTTEESRKSPQIYTALVKVLKNETRPENIRARAAGIIAESGRPSACSDLIGALRTGGLSETSVVEILRALGKIGDKQAVPMLKDMLVDKSAVIRRAAAQSLRRITFYDFGEDAAAWEKWWQQNKNKTRAQWQEEFVRALQKDRADEMIADLKAVAPDTVLNTVLKVFREPSGNIISPHDRYGAQYAEVIKCAVDAVVSHLKAADYPQVLPHLEALLASDDEKIRDAAMNYFTSTNVSVPHEFSSIKPLLDCFRNPAETEPIKDDALLALKITVAAVTAADPAKITPEIRTEIVAAIAKVASSDNAARRELAVDILGPGLMHADGLMVLVRLLKFEAKPSDAEADVKWRRYIAFKMGPVLKTNGSLNLSDKQKAEITAILARTFVLDLKVADKVALLLAYVGYKDEIVVAESKFAGVAGLLASRLEEKVDWGFAQDADPAVVARTVRDIRRGVLDAFAGLKNGATEDRIIAVLQNPKVIDPNEKVGEGETTLCEAALATLGTVGRDKAADYLLASGLLNSAKARIKEQAWKSLRDVVQRIYNDGHYEFLADREKALKDAEDASKPESNAKSACNKARTIIEDAGKALEKAVNKVNALIKDLDSAADKAKADKARAAIEVEIVLNRNAMLSTLVTALDPAANNPKPITDALRAILAKHLKVPEGQDINTMTYEQIKQLLAAQ